jgi:hypothetical protein
MTPPINELAILASFVGSVRDALITPTISKGRFESQRPNSVQFSEVDDKKSISVKGSYRLVSDAEEVPAIHFPLWENAVERSKPRR